MNAQELADFIRQHPEQAQRFRNSDYLATPPYRASALVILRGGTVDDAKAAADAARREWQ